MSFNMEVEMVEYDHVKDRANISFISSKGNPMSIWINRTTFEKLMLGPWDKVQMGDPNLYQRELRSSLQRKVRGAFMKWFETHANRIMKDNTTGDNKV